MRESTRQLAVIHSSLEGARAKVRSPVSYSSASVGMATLVRFSAIMPRCGCFRSCPRRAISLLQSLFLRKRGQPAGVRRLSARGTCWLFRFHTHREFAPAKLLPQLRDAATASLSEFQRVDRKVAQLRRRNFPVSVFAKRTVMHKIRFRVIVGRSPRQTPAWHVNWRYSPGVGVGVGRGISSPCSLTRSIVPSPPVRSVSVHKGPGWLERVTLVDD